jgi:hypothetical protein
LPHCTSHSHTEWPGIELRPLRTQDIAWPMSQHISVHMRVIVTCMPFVASKSKIQWWQKILWMEWVNICTTSQTQDSCSKDTQITSYSHCWQSNIPEECNLSTTMYNVTEAAQISYGYGHHDRDWTEIGRQLTNITSSYTVLNLQFWEGKEKLKFSYWAQKLLLSTSDQQVDSVWWNKQITNH